MSTVKQLAGQVNWGALEQHLLSCKHDEHVARLRALRAAILNIKVMDLNGEKEFFASRPTPYDYPFEDGVRQPPPPPEPPPPRRIREGVRTEPPVPPPSMLVREGRVLGDGPRVVYQQCAKHLGRTMKLSATCSAPLAVVCPHCEEDAHYGRG